MIAEPLREDEMSRISLLGAAVITVGLIAPAAHAQELTPGAKLQLTPGVTRTVIQKTDFPGDQYATLLYLAEMAPGATVPYHTHPGVESAYVLEGQGDLAMGHEAAKRIKAGDAYQMPAGMPHSIRNGDQPTKLIVTLVYEKNKPMASPAPE
jgi:quercetin dioxygenase-like cupin family protein